MMRADDVTVDCCASCPMCSHFPAQHWLARGRHLLAKLCPLTLTFSLWPWHRMLRIFKSSRRRFLVLTAAAFSMTTILTCLTLSHPMGPRNSWTSLGSGRRESTRDVCSLQCPHLMSGQTTWRPGALPLEHACLTSATLPLACPPNATRSQLLLLRPISFLKNYLNPCWYESAPDTYQQEDNPYTHNLFACFSHGSVKSFKTLYEKTQKKEKVKEESPRRRLRCLPLVYMAGMPKCGSTDLFRKLMLHPDVVRPPMKEPHWWSKNRFGQRLNYSTAIPLRDYMDLFDKAAGQIEKRYARSYDVTVTNAVQTKHDDVSRVDYHGVVTVDASASTFWNNDEWWRLPENCGRLEPLFTNAHYIRRLTPQAKIIVILRNPTERLYSDYLYFTKHNKSVAAFHHDVLLSIEKFTACTNNRSLRSCVYDKRVAGGKAKVRLRVGVYHVYMTEWLKLFPRNQLLVLRTEDYSRRLRHVTRQMYHFLGLRPLTKEQERRVERLPIANARRPEDRQLGAMWPQTRRVLDDFYHQYNQRLAELLHDSRFLWQDAATLTYTQGTHTTSRPDATLTNKERTHTTPSLEATLTSYQRAHTTHPLEANLYSNQRSYTTQYAVTLPNKQGTRITPPPEATLTNSMWTHTMSHPENRTPDAGLWTRRKYGNRERTVLGGKDGAQVVQEIRTTPWVGESEEEGEVKKRGKEVVEHLEVVRRNPASVTSDKVDDDLDAEYAQEDEEDDSEYDRDGEEKEQWEENVSSEDDVDYNEDDDNEYYGNE